MGLLQLVLLKRGSKGTEIKKMQEALGIDADGKFGPGTEKAVRDYQEANGLKADGLAGPNTLTSLKLFSSADVAAARGGAASADAANDGGVWDSVEEAASGALDRVKSIFGF